MDNPILPKHALSPASERPALITWPCYEPAGHQVQLTAADLLQHVLAIGATGSGKTTLLISAVQQLTAREAGDSERKSGLLILDSKTELVPLVRASARAAGRLADVVVLGPEGNACYDLFGALRSLEDVETVTRRLLLAIPPLGGENAYWQTSMASMVAASLSLLVATEPVVTFDSALQFMRTWFMGARVLPKRVQDTVAKAKEQIPQTRDGALAAQNHQLQGALDQVGLWQELDPKTRSNLQSCLLNLLRPLMSSTAARCFGQGGRPPFDPGQAACDGLICVVSVNSLTERELARFLFRLARQSFFDAVQRRIGADHRLCGVVADEFPLIVCREDAEQLATLRSKGCFVMAATQGLAGIDDQVGERSRRAVLQHFNTLIFLRSLEEEAGCFASLTLGLRPKNDGFVTRKKDGWFFFSFPSPRSAMVPVCRPGDLSRLAAHQAYVLCRDGSRTHFPVWFVPWFESQDRPDPVETPSAPQGSSQAAASHVRQLFRSAGIPTLWAPEVVMAACRLCQPKEEREDLLKAVTGFFQAKSSRVPEGLKDLPTCWLVALPGILDSFPPLHRTKLPLSIRAVACADGVLLLEFALEQLPVEPNAAIWNQIRLAVNLRIYPSVWRPLSRQHRWALWRDHPGLRPALAGQDLEV